MEKKNPKIQIFAFPHCEEHENLVKMLGLKNVIWMGNQASEYYDNLVKFIEVAPKIPHDFVLLSVGNRGGKKDVWGKLDSIKKMRRCKSINLSETYLRS